MSYWKRKHCRNISKIQIKCRNDQISKYNKFIFINVEYMYVKNQICRKYIKSNKKRKRRNCQKCEIEKCRKSQKYLKYIKCYMQKMQKCCENCQKYPNANVKCRMSSQIKTTETIKYVKNIENGLKMQNMSKIFRMHNDPKKKGNSETVKNDIYICAKMQEMSKMLRDA